MNWKERPWKRIEEGVYLTFEQFYSWGVIWVTCYIPENTWSGAIEYEGCCYYTRGRRDLPSIMDGIQELLEKVGLE